jgi:hypothetical protein
MDATFYFSEACVTDIFRCGASCNHRFVKVLKKREKKLTKLNKQISKLVEFYADFTAVEKVAKKCIKTKFCTYQQV